MKKDRILFILHLPPPVHGAAMMGQYIQESTLLNERFDAHYVNLATAGNLAHIGQFRFTKIYSFVKLIWVVVKEILCFRPQLVYVTPTAKGKAFVKDFIIVQVIKCFGLPVVAHYHNKGVAHSHSLLARWAYKLFFHKISLILLSEELYADVRQYVAIDRVSFCPNGIPELAPLANANRDAENILFLSNLLIEKGIYVLLDACALLKKQGIAFTCHIVGGETQELSSKKLLEEIAQRDLQAELRYWGKRYGQEKQQMLAQAAIFVLPTFEECFPLVLLEAMQMETACVASIEGGIPSIIQEGVTGLMIEKQNAQQLATTIACLLQQPALAQAMGKAGRRKYEQEFTLVQFEKTLQSILEKHISLQQK